MKMWILGSGLSVLVLVASAAAWLGPLAEGDAAGGTQVEAKAQQVEASLQFQHASAQLTSSGVCSISCTDGSFFSVRTFSISSCCESCADLCNSECVASGPGPSVLCGGF